MMRFFTLLLFVSLVGSINAQIIWGGAGEANSEFDGGPNDWIIEAISDEDALWIWEADGANELGAYSGADVNPIESPSVANGAMGFDSDFYDNAGIPGNFEMGVAIAPQRATLTSPSMDCSGQPAVALDFFQFYRDFTNTVRTVNVSNDGGTTWTPFVLPSRGVNVGGEPRDRVLVDISSVAADQANVMLQFDYNANYYFWLIDDIVLRVPPANNVRLVDGRLPTAAWTMPEHMIKSDTLNFAAQVINEGTADNMGGTVTAEILDNAGSAVYTFSEETAMIPTGDTILHVFDAEVIPADITLTEGAYTVRYTLETIDEDFDSFDNNTSIDFNVTNNVYQTNNEISTAFNFGAGFVPGVTFRTGELADNTELQVDSITIGGASNGTIENPECAIYFFKVKNQLSDELDPIYSETNLGTPDDEHPNLELIGQGFYSGVTLGNFDEVTVEVFNADASDVLILEESSTYLVATQWNETMEFVNASNQIFYYQQTNMLFTTQWFTLGSDPANGNLAWGMPLQINLNSVIATEDVELDEDAVSVFPNPAKDFTSVNLDFDVPTSATIMLSDAMGRFISTKSVEKVTSTKVNFDVSALPAGAYNFQIRTSENAVSTKSFMIVD